MARAILLAAVAIASIHAAGAFSLALRNAHLRPTQPRCTHCVAVASEPSKPTAASENPLPQSGHVSLEIPTAHACQNLHAS